MATPHPRFNFIEEPQAGGAATNRELHTLARHLRCRKLAGSALVGILKPPGRYSTRKVDRRLMACPWIRNYCTRVLRWVIEKEQTRYLKVVACLGNAAFSFVCEALNLSMEARHRLAMEKGSTARAGRVLVSHLWHPSRSPEGGRSRAALAWRRMADESGIRFVE